MTISGLLKSNKIRTIVIFTLLILVSGLDTISSYLFKPATDALSQGNLRITLEFFILMILAGIISMVLDAFSQTLYSRQTQNYIDSLRQKIIIHFYKKNDQTVAEMQNELSNNFDMLVDNYATPLLTIITNSLTLIFTIGILIDLNWTLLVLTAVLAIINLLTPKIMEKATSKANKNISLENSKLLKSINDWMGGIQELRRYSSFLTLSRTMNKASSNFENSNIKNAQVISLSLFISNLTNTISQISISLWAGILFFQGNLTIGAALVVGNFASQIFNAIWIYEQALTQLNSAKGINSTTRVLEQEITNNDTDNLSDDLAQLEIKNLLVKYPNGESISYPNIIIKRGEKVLLTGDSGTGKSTLFKTILGQVVPAKGKITFKDSNNTEIMPNLGKIGYIAQDSVLFPDTIKNNITMFNSALDYKIPDVVNSVQFQNDINKFPKGINTIIDLDKDNLSGGQKQKVILARSQIHKSQFVLMDEATSAIDKKATEKIFKSLLNSNITLVLIAHNLDDHLQSMFDRKIHLRKEKTNVD